MKRLPILLLLVLALSCTSPVKEASKVISRVFGECPANVRLVLSSHGEDSTSFYALSVRNNILTVEGNSAVAICKGFHDYILDKGYGINSWSGNRLDFPQELEDMPRTVTVSPYRDRLFLNVCTFGYTTPFWGWERWEQELDWMALHGFDMPLAPIGYEVILSRALEGIGIIEEESGEFFTGPAHLPWNRMGNMSQLDGKTSRKWKQDQIALQHKLLGRMQRLGMKPVIQAFAGYVPEAVEKHYPGRDYTHAYWHSKQYGTVFLSPLDSLFGEIGTRFVKEWEKEFGRGKYFLADSFNEMKLPFAPIGDPERYTVLKACSEAIYRSLTDADPDAIWVMQGWMFGRNRDIWEPRSVEALLSGAPKGRMIVVDLAVEFNRYDWKNGNNYDVFPGFYGTEWMWSTTPNFGGRSGSKGVLEFYLNGHLSALDSPNRGNLVGYGCSPEGIEANEVVYELVSSAAWSSKEKNLQEFLRKYSRARYGVDIPGIEEYWEELCKGVYDNFTQNDVLLWQRRPAYHYQSCLSIDEHYFKGIEAFFTGSEALAGNRLYEIDAIQNASFYLAYKGDRLFDRINHLLGENRREEAAPLQDTLLVMLEAADRLLESHPIYRLERWTGFARSAGCNPEESERFVTEARKLVSVWGVDGLQDYSARIWSGLIRDLYIPRLRNYFASAADHGHFDFKAFDEMFPARKDISAIEPYANPLEAASNIVRRFEGLDIAADKPHTEFWTSQDIPSNKPNVLYFNCHSDNIRSLKAMEFSVYNGSVRIDKVTIRNRWDEIHDFYPNISIRSGETKSVSIGLPPEGLPGMGRVSYVRVTMSDAAGSSGIIRYVK